jgi:hypothetical protein
MTTAGRKRRKWLPSALILEQYDEEGDEFRNHIVRVTGEET